MAIEQIGKDTEKHNIEFNSVQFRNLWRIINKTLKGSKMKCENCGESHDGSYASGRFCSKECAKGFSTKNNRHEISRKVSIANGGTGILKERLTHCLKCGEKLKINSKKFCSHTCHRLFEKEESFKQVEESGKFRNSENTRFPKKYLTEKYGHKCMICENTEWMKLPIPLVLDHIDGNSDNWDVSNCRLICHNCNAQTPTFSGRNVGKFITKRSSYRTKYRKR